MTFDYSMLIVQKINTEFIFTGKEFAGPAVLLKILFQGTSSVPQASAQTLSFQGLN
ncbi:hypothetical protein REC12_17555 [Desulfosporosinus sp. PR]|nr:hypothetical protein [Desulfosporosinus sp. PR]